MPIQVECPSCRSAFRVGEDYAGKRGKCPRCREPIVVPAPEDVVGGLVPSDPPEPRRPARPAPVAPDPEDDPDDTEGYEVAGRVKAKAVPVRAGGAGAIPEGVAKAVEPARPTQTPKQILAAFRGEIEPVRPTHLYRLWIVVVAAVMLLLPVVYMAIIGLIVYALCLHVVYDFGVFQTLRDSRAAVAAYVGPIVAGAVVIGFMLKPLFARPGQKQKTRALDPAVEPLLFAFVDGVCASVGAPRPRRIEVNCDVNASAHRDAGPLAVFSNELVLTIGLPLAAGMNLRQFAGVLAHEFGHFSQGAGMRLSFLVRSISFWFARVVYQRDEWDETLASWSSGGNAYGMLLALIARSAVWLTRKVLWLLMWAGNLVSGFLLRQMEFDADRYEARMVGGKVFASTCWRLRELSLATNGAFADLQSSWQERRLPDNFPKLILANVAQIPAEVMAAYRKASGQAKTGLLDTHPSDRDRIARARAEGDDGVFHLDGPATDLFRNFDSLARAGTFDYYRTLIGPEVSKDQLFAVAELVQTQAVTQEGHQAFDRYFLDAYHPTQRLPLEWNYPKAPADLKAAAKALLQARAAQGSARAGNLGAAKVWERLHERAIVADTAWTLRKADHPIKAADFGLDKPTARAAEEAREAALADLRLLDDRFTPFAAAGARRLTLALALLEADAVAARVPDGPARRGEARALYPCVAHLGGRVIPDLPVLHRDLQTLARLLNTLQQAKSQSQPLINACLRAGKQLHDRLEEFRWKIGDTLNYPFEHSQEDATLVKYALPRVPPAENVGELGQAAQDALERITTLYRRALGRLTVTAEEVERALGLPPLPTPDPVTPDDDPD